MANGMTAAQARVVERFNKLNGSGDLELVELTKDGSDKVRFGAADAEGDLIAIVLSAEVPEETYTVSSLGSNDVSGDNE